MIAICDEVQSTVVPIQETDCPPLTLDQKIQKFFAELPDCPEKPATKDPIHVFLASLEIKTRNIAGQLWLLGLALEEVQQALQIPDFQRHLSRILSSRYTKREKLWAIRQLIKELFGTPAGKDSEDALQKPPQDKSLQRPPEDEETQQFWATLPDDHKFVMQKLLKLGFTLEELRQAFRLSDLFINYVKAVMGFFNIPLEQRLAKIREQIPKIAKMSDDEIAAAAEKIEFPAKSEKKQKKNKQPRQPNNDTLRRLLILAAMWEQDQEITIAELVKLTGLNKKHIRAALKDLEKEGLVKINRKNKHHLYKLTHKGAGFLVEKLKGMFRQCEILSLFSNSQSRNVPDVRQALLTLIKQAIEITKELTKLGWWHRCIRAIFKEHRLAYIQKWIERVKNDPQVKNKGAYLVTVLLKANTSKSEEKRKEAMAVKIVEAAGVAKVLSDTFREEAKSLTPRQALRLALAIRSRFCRCQRENLDFHRGDVIGIAGWVRKKTPA